MSNTSNDASPDHVATVHLPPPETLRRVALAAEAWGGLWQPEGELSGRLGLPVTAGLRRGWVAGPLSIEPHPEGSRLELKVENSELRINLLSFCFLLLAAFGALSVVFTPFVPSLLPLMPFGIVLAVAAWFLIINQLRNSGPDEFFASLGEE